MGIAGLKNIRKEKKKAREGRMAMPSKTTPGHSVSARLSLSKLSNHLKYATYSITNG
jgi:hypothetical protein